VILTKYQLQNLTGAHAATWRQKLAADLSLICIGPYHFHLDTEEKFASHKHASLLGFKSCDIEKFFSKQFALKKRSSILGHLLLFLVILDLISGH
jgi:hypothetical protein